MPARRAASPLPAPVDDPFEDLRALLRHLDPDQVAYYYRTADPDVRALIDRLLAEEAAVGIRANPVTLMIALDGVDVAGAREGDKVMWRNLAVLGPAFADAIFRRRPRQEWRVPSQTGKTTLLGKWGPIWALDHNPRLRLMYVSYDADKAVEEAGEARDIARYYSADLRFQLRPDHQARGMWKTDEGGGLYATGINGSITGFPADGVIGDDLIKGWEAGHSPAVREKAWRVFTSQMRMRLQRPDDPLILGGTCWHEDDVLMRAVRHFDGLDRFELIRIPAIAEAPSRDYPDPDPLGRVPGEIIDPRRFTADEVHARARALGSYLASAMEQGRPAPEQGTDILRDWFRQETTIPDRYDQWATSWDMKLKEKEQGDYVVGMVIARIGGDFWIRDIMRGQWNQTTTRAAMALAMVRWPYARTHYYENAGYGPEVAEQLRKAQPDYILSDDVAGAIGATETERAAVEAILRHGVSGLIPVTPKGPKPVRARAVSPIAEAGNVHVPAGALWLDTFLTEVSSFPNGAHDDQVDAWSQGLSRMSRGTATIDTPDDVRIERPTPGHVRPVARNGVTIQLPGQRGW